MTEKFTKENIYGGRITSGIKLKTFQLKIINFVFEQLPNWRDDHDRPDGDSEPVLNPQLSIFLDCKARNDFSMIHFCHEEPQLPNRSVDVAVKPIEKMTIEAQRYTAYTPIIVFECKRLPAPDIKREKEYVTGIDSNKISGGIQRFKLGFHGNKYDMAAMIGYVQDKPCSYWHGKINEWILELVKKPIGDGCLWKSGEILNAIAENKSVGSACYVSTHKRQKLKDEIKIHHLWITMNKK
jgi:hypothetical protein